MRNNKINSKDWHFDYIPVIKEEFDKIREQMEDGIPPNMSVIRADRIFCGGDEVLRYETGNQSILHSGIEKKYLMLEEEIEKDIVRRIQKAGKIVAAYQCADSAIQ